MPKSEMPASVQKLSDNEYDQWYAVYSSARDEGDSKSTAAKKAWGALKEAVSGDPDVQRPQDRSPFQRKPDSPLAPFPVSEKEKAHWHSVYISALNDGSDEMEAREKAWDAVSKTKGGSVKKEHKLPWVSLKEAAAGDFDTLELQSSALLARVQEAKRAFREGAGKQYRDHMKSIGELAHKLADLTDQLREEF